MQDISFRNSSFGHIVSSTRPMEDAELGHHVGDVFKHKGQLVYVPILEHSLNEYDYLFDQACWATCDHWDFRPEHIRCGAPVVLSVEDRRMMEVMRRFDQAKAFSKEDNEAEAARVIEDGIALPPVLSVGTAYNFGDGAYGDMLLARGARNVWHEVLVPTEHHFLPMEKKEKKLAKQEGRQAFKLELYVDSTTLIGARSAKGRESEAYEDASPEVKKNVFDYYLHAIVLPMQRDGKDTGSSYIFKQGFNADSMDKFGMRLDSALVSWKKAGVLIAGRSDEGFGKTASEFAFVPTFVEKRPCGASLTSLMVASAERVSVDSFKNIKTAQPFDKPERMVPFLKYAFEKPNGNPYSCANARVMLVPR